MPREMEIVTDFLWKFQDVRKEYDKCIPPREKFEYVSFLKCNFHFQCEVSYNVHIQYTYIYTAHKEAISNLILKT